MGRRLVLALFLALSSGTGLAAQDIAVAVDDALVPRGRLRVQMSPVYKAWDSRFGRTADFVTRREALGDDLTSESAEMLFPATESLVAAIESMTGSSGYTPVLGASTGRVAKEVTRIEFGGHLGIFDWLTVGVMLPWTRTATSVDVYFAADSVNGDLGLNPVGTDGAGVSAFLQAVSAAALSAEANASAICGSSPGSGACDDAQALATRTSSFSAAAAEAYGASPFFPMVGTEAGTAVSAATTALHNDLVAAGLSGIGVPLVLATQWISEENFRVLSSTPGYGIEGAPLGDVRTPWQAGDLELSASFRVLDGDNRASPEDDPSFAYRVIGTLLTRLPTGATEDPDVFFDVGSGDGQTDFEGRLLGDVLLGGRLGLRAAARYGIQLSRTVTRRVVAPEVVFAPLSTRQTLEWDPGSYFGVEVAPSFRLFPELSLGAEYRVYRKYRDSYSLTGESVGAPVNPAVLETESGVTVHNVGGIVRYDTVARRMATGSGVPMQLHLRFQWAVAGGGGQTPIPSRIEVGARLFRRFWGPS